VWGGFLANVAHWGGELGKETHWGGEAHLTIREDLRKGFVGWGEHGGDLKGTMLKITPRCPLGIAV